MSARACRSIVSMVCGALLLSSVGCAAFANKADYADYRKVRLAHGEADRLIAIAHYLDAHPQGQWHQELAHEQATRESEVYEQGKATRQGLELYVRAYPRGHFTAQAQARLQALTQIEQRKAQEREAAQRAIEEQRTRDEELRRTWVTRFFTYWSDTLLSVGQWGAPIADIARLNPEFSRAFGKSPRPQCNADECVKHYRSNFGVPVPGGNRVERTIELTLRLALHEGRVVRVELLFPRRGFSRWFELENRRVVVDEDPQMRAEAIAWAMTKIKPLMAKVGASATEVTDLAFEAVLPLSTSATAEITDTTAVDPSSQAQGVVEDPQRAQQPDGDQPAPDMVIGPITIPSQGHSVQTTPATPTGEDSGAVMTLGPIDASGDQSAGEGATMTLGAIGDPTEGSSGAAPAPVTPVVQPQQTYSLSADNLRVTVFAETPGAWDGLRIEPITPRR